MLLRVGGHVINKTDPTYDPGADATHAQERMVVFPRPAVTMSLQELRGAHIIKGDALGFPVMSTTTTNAGSETILAQIEEDLRVRSRGATISFLQRGLVCAIPARRPFVLASNKRLRKRVRAPYTCRV